jgi:hypothetical protein
MRLFDSARNSAVMQPHMPSHTQRPCFFGCTGNGVQAKKCPYVLGERDIVLAGCGYAYGLLQRTDTWVLTRRLSAMECRCGDSVP